MTPLAHRIVKELTLPAKDRGMTVHDPDGVARLLSDTHCFDFSNVMPLLQEVRCLLPERGSLANACQTLGERAFLPADKTWIECVMPGSRLGYLLVRHGSGAALFTAIAGDTGLAGAMFVGHIPIEDSSFIPRLHKNWTAEQLAGDMSRIYAALAIINTPRLIGRKQHMPHRGLERRLANAKGLVGKFPLHAWTELTLSVSAMMTEADGTVHEAHYTGEKCLHFCRAHLRVRNGRLEQVKAHWRGNPALGIKRTRYRLAA